MEGDLGQAHGRGVAMARKEMLNSMLEAARNIDFKLPPKAGKIGDAECGQGNSGPELLVKAAVNAFFDQNLYAAAKELREGIVRARGTEGWCVLSC